MGCSGGRFFGLPLGVDRNEVRAEDFREFCSLGTGNWKEATGAAKEGSKRMVLANSPRNLILKVTVQTTVLDMDVNDEIAHYFFSSRYST